MRPGDIAFDRFEIERKAGSGAMGTVYRAKDRLGGEPVALKVLSGREAVDAERFAREGAVLSALTHPGIVRYVAHGTQGSEHFLAMEWLDGEDLSTRLAREGLTIAESVRLVRRVAEALAIAHRRGVVHRDIKPSNLFLPGHDIDRVKLLDFGIARLTREGRGVTLTGAMLGTPGYMAPEQAQGARDLDTRADVFSLGCVLFKCVTGRAAFSGENVLAVLAKTILEEAPRASELRQDVPQAVDDFIARLLAKDPAKRPVDAAAVALDIAALGDLSGPRSAPASNKGAALTANERRVVCVVLVGGASGMSEAAATLTMAHFTAREGALRQSVESHGGKLDFLADGSILVTLSSTSAATDQAVRAARCALEMRAVLPGVPMVLATGGVLSSSLTSEDGAPPASDLIDRGVRLLGRGVLDEGIWLDDATAGLLDVRFDVRGVAQGEGIESALYLRGERDLVEATRTLLGKPYPCVGRDRELAFLESVFDECAGEPIARAVLFTAPAGRGKSRVRYEFMERLKARGARVEVLFGRGDSLSAGSPFGMIGPAIRRSAGILEGDPIEIKQKRLRARMAPRPLARSVWQMALGPLLSGLALIITGLATATIFSFVCVRNLFAWSFDRLMPSWLTKLASRRNSPYASIAVIWILSILFVAVYYLTIFFQFYIYSSLLIFLAFIFASIAAILFPYRRKDIFNVSPSIVTKNIAGIPWISILGVLGVIIDAYLAYATLQPAVTPPLSGALIQGLAYAVVPVAIVVAFIIYGIAYSYRKSQGLDLRIAFAEIPPE